MIERFNVTKDTEIYGSDGEVGNRGDNPTARTSYSNGGTRRSALFGGFELYPRDDIKGIKQATFFVRLAEDLDDSKNPITSSFGITPIERGWSESSSSRNHNHGANVRIPSEYTFDISLHPNDYRAGDWIEIDVTNIVQLWHDNNYEDIHFSSGPGYGIRLFSKDFSSSSRTTHFYTRESGHTPYLEVEFIPVNNSPTISLSTSNNRTLYENDTYNISGTAQDSDAGDVVTVRYSINNGQERAIDTRISDGSSFSFNHTLTFRQGRLYRNDTAVTGELAEGSEHVLRVWVEDDNGGQSEVVQRSFYVVPNRMPELTVEPFGSRTDLIDSDKITFRGEASDPDGNDITVSYKINNGSYQQVYSGQGGAFEFQVAVGDLDAGENNVTIRSQDSYGAEVQKVLRVNKSGVSVPLKTAVERYKIIPPNGTAKGVVLWLQRETGDLIANARIHMGANGEPENFQDMTLEATSFVEDGIEEDEWTFDNGEEAENIILEITMERNSTSSDEGIKLINGVLS